MGQPLNAGRVLVVEDEQPMARMLNMSLSASGFSVDVVWDGESALRSLDVFAPDLVLLDLGLPDLDGREVIRRMRMRSDIPIIVLTARSEVSERIAALDNGADDYVTKPFDAGELQARIRTALRRRRSPRASVHTIPEAGLLIDLDRRLIMLDDLEVKVTPKEFALLRELIVHDGGVVTHRQLLQAGWQDAEADPQFVRIYIAQLRQKLEADASRPSLILNVPGVGYRWRTPREGD